MGLIVNLQVIGQNKKSYSIPIKIAPTPSLRNEKSQINGLMNSLIKFPIEHAKSQQAHKASKHPARKKHESKLTGRYWKTRVFKRSYEYQGKRIELPDYHYRFRYKNNTYSGNLHTSSQEEAGRLALAQYQAAIKGANRKPNHRLTLGDYLRHHASAPENQRSNIDKDLANCRLLASELQEISAPSRFSTKLEHLEWVQKIEMTRLKDLTERHFQVWIKKQRLQIRKGRGTGPNGGRTSLVSVDNLVRSWRVIFGDQTTREDLGVESVAGFKVGLTKTKSTPLVWYRTAEELIDLAYQELALDDIEAYKLFWICIGAGLRRGEADKARWSDFNFESNQLQLHPRADRPLKTENSSLPIKLQVEVADFYRKCFEEHRSDERFVLVSTSKRKSKSPKHYRANATEVRLIGWLRKHGIKDKKPIHWLRRAYGGSIEKSHGITESSRALRHTSIKTTERSYAVNHNTQTTEFQVPE